LAVFNVLPRHSNNRKESSMTTCGRIWFQLLCSLLLVGLLSAGEPTSVERPPRWAQAIRADGVPNLFKVSDDLYRSAQPTARGMQALRKLGVETVVNLRSFHSDRDEIGETGLGYEHIYMKAWHPEEKELVRFLQIATNTKRTPVLVHCQEGADRTGLMCAVYRIAVQGWTKQQAIEEMQEGGYGFNPVWTNIGEYIDQLDVKDISRRAGLGES
jgi:protein tyrosine/serine phosphatase